MRTKDSGLQLKRLAVPFEIRAVNDDGTFTGYGSVFGVKDAYDEIVAKGAFAESLQGRMPALLWQHRSGEPIGVYTDAKEDDIGLVLSGRLALKTQRGAEAHELLKMKAITGMSIGFVTREDSFDKATGIRTLKKVDLWEVSLVTFPANDAARVTGVKGFDPEHLPDIKSFERFLRESGFSRSQATAIAGHGLKYLLRSESDAEAMQKQVSQALADLRSISLM